MARMQDLFSNSGLDELTAFIAAVETGSFAAAGKKLKRDASIVSRRISQLERKLGAQLLARTTRHLVLTEAGSLYYRRVQVILQELQNASLEASNCASTPQGLLRVSMPTTFGRKMVAPHIKAFLTQYPQIRIDASFTDRRVDVVAEGYDVAIRIGAAGDNVPSALKIGAFHTMLAASPDYVAKRGQPAMPANLSSHDCLSHSNHVSWPDWVLKKDGQRKTVRPSGPLISDQSEILLQAAVDGLGIVQALNWLVEPEIRAGRLVEVLPGWRGSLESEAYVVIPPGTMIPAKTRVFIDAVTGWARSNIDG